MTYFSFSEMLRFFLRIFMSIIFFLNYLDINWLKVKTTFF